MIGKRSLVALSIILMLLTFCFTAQAQSSNDQPEQPCPACGTMNRQDAKFCKNCGTALTARPESEGQSSIPYQDRSRMLPGNTADQPLPGIMVDLESLSREELIQLVRMMEQNQRVQGAGINLPEGSIAYMTESELRSLVTEIVKGAKQTKVQTQAPRQEGPFGVVLKLIGGVTLFILIIAVIAI